MKKLVGILLLIGFISVLWCGCKEKELPGSIYGVVTDLATGEPVKTAGVELQPTGLKTITGSEGQYEFTETDPGVYKLHITKTGYAELMSSEIIVKSNKATQSDVQIEKLPPALKILDGAGTELDTLDFGDAEADEARSFNIFNDGSEGLQWQISKTAKWIESFSVESGELEAGGTQAVVVTIDRNLLDEKQNATTIQITSNNGSKELLVLAMNNRETMVVNVAAASDVTASTAVFHGEIVNGGNPPVTERGFVYTTESVATLENTIEKLTVAVNEQKEYSIQVRNLELGKTYNVRAYASNILGVVYSSNSVSVIPEATLPAVETESITSVNIAEGTAIFNGNVFESGDPTYTEKGFVYGNVPNPTVDDQKKVVSGSGTGKYSANINGLEEGKVYHIRAYATNANGTAYGADKNIDLTAKMPEVQTKTATNRNVANGTVTFNGTVMEIGDLPYTERGFVYSEVHNPTLDDTKVTASGSGTGDFSANASEIQEGKVYYIRAYVTNRKGTVYGEEVSVDFNAVMPTVQTKTPTNKNIANGTVTFNGTVMEIGDLPYTERGFVYSEVHNPTLDDTKVTASGNGTGDFSANASEIQEGKVYYIRAYVANRKGTVYGEEVSLDFNALMPTVQTKTPTNKNIANGTFTFNGTVAEIGDLPYTERGFVYSEVHNPTLEDTKVTASGSGAGDFSANATDIQEGKVYYIRAYVTNRKGTVYGEEVSVDFNAVMPEVQTKEITNRNVANGTVTFNGIVAEIGDLPYTERGFVYSEVHNPTLDDTKVTASGSGTGDFSANASGIQEGKVYYIRAYVTNSKGTVYGEEVSVDFNALMPTVQTKTPTNKNIATGTVTFNGTVAEMGDLPYTERGFVYSEVHNPTLDDTKVTASGSGTGDFSANATDIQEGKVYYIRAYVTNSKGTVYGEEASVDFNAVMPTVQTKTPTNKNIATGTVTFNGTVAEMGDLPYTERGFVYSEVHNPTLDDTKVTASGSGTGDFSANASGIQEGKVYYVRAHVTNSKGTVYGEEVNLNFIADPPLVSTDKATNIRREEGSAVLNGTITREGDLGYIERGFVYGTNVNPTIEDDIKKIVVGSGIGKYSASVSGLQIGSIYYVRAYVISSKETVYGANITVDYNPVNATISTLPTSNIDAFSATLNGSIDEIGDPCYTEKGFVYSNTPNPTTNDNKVTVNGKNNGTYFANITNLKAQTTYYVKAYVVSNGEIIYGNEYSFYTESPYFYVINGANLMVAKSDISTSATTWTSANTSANSLVVGGYSDWRLPSIEELTILYQYKETIGGFQQPTTSGQCKGYIPVYWSSSKGEADGTYKTVNFNDTGAIEDYEKDKTGGSVSLGCCDIHCYTQKMVYFLTYARAVRTITK